MPKDQHQSLENVLLAWRRRSQKAQQESLAWNSGDDPILSDAVYRARLRLHHYTTGEIEQAISLLTSLIERELSLPEVKQALGFMLIDEQGEVYEPEGPVEIDPVDLLMLTYPRVFKASGDKIDTLEEAMMLLTLREARANRLGVALKAFYVGSHKRAEDGYREWKETMQRSGCRVGKLPTMRRGILEFTRQIIREDPRITAKGALRKFPDADHKKEVGAYEVYKDGERLYERNSVTGDERFIKEKTIYRYLRTAKNELYPDSI